MKNSILLVSFLLTVLCFSMVSADVVLPWAHRVSYSFEISNINDFPDYTFFYFVCGPGDNLCENTLEPTIVKVNEVNTPHFYKFASAKLYTIKNNLFNNEIRLDTPGLINLNFTFYSGVSYVGNRNPLAEIKDIFEIVQTTDGFKLEQIKVAYYYTDGPSEEKTVKNGQKPNPSRTLTRTLIAVYFLIPLLALIVLLYLLIGRKNGK